MKGQIFLKVKEHSDTNEKLSETDIINIGSQISIGASLLINFFLYSYEAELVPLPTNIVTIITPLPL